MAINPPAFFEEETLTLTGDETLSLPNARRLLVTASGTNRNLTLPTASAVFWSSGAEVTLTNIGTSNNVVVKNPDTTTLDTLEPGEYGRYYNSNGTWFIGDSSNTGAGSGTDSDAIHDNVASEISAVTAKGSPTSSDYLLIEDAADSNNKKSITIGDLPNTSSDTDAIHDNVAAEISAISETTPAAGDHFIFEDASNSNAKGRVLFENLSNYPSSDLTRPEDFATVAETSLAPGGALTDDGTAGVDWYARLGFGQSLSIDTGEQPPSAVGSVHWDGFAHLLDPVGNPQYTGVDFEEDKDGTGQILSFWFKHTAQKGSNGNVEVVICSTAQQGVTATDRFTTNVIHRQDIHFAHSDNGYWQEIQIPCDDMSSQTIRAVGVKLKEKGVHRDHYTAFFRGNWWIADVKFKRQTELENAMLDGTTTVAVAEPTFSPGVTEDPMAGMLQSTRNFLDLRPARNIWSNFNGMKFARQYGLDDTGTTAINDSWRTMMQEVEDGDVIVMAPGKYLVTGNESLILKDVTNFTILGNGARIFRDTRADVPLFDMTNLNHVYIRDLHCYGYRTRSRDAVITLTDNVIDEDHATQARTATGTPGADGVAQGDVLLNLTDGSYATINSTSGNDILGDALTGGSDNSYDVGDVIAVVRFLPQSGQDGLMDSDYGVEAIDTGTVSGSSLQLDTQYETFRTGLYRISNAENKKWRITATLSDTNQVAQDFYWELRTQNRTLSETDHTNGLTNVPLTDAVIATWDSGTKIMTFASGDMVNDGVEANMRVFMGAQPETTNYGQIATVDSATQITLSNNNGTFTVGQTVRIGRRTTDDTPLLQNANADWQGDGIMQGDMLLNTDDNSWATIGQVRTDEIRLAADNTYQDGTLNEISNNDTFQIYRELGHGWETLTATPTEYTFEVDADDIRLGVYFYFRKARSTANTIKVDNVTIWNPVTEQLPGKAASNFFSSSYEDAHAWWFGGACHDVTFENCEVEGAFGGDAWAASNPNVKRVKLINCTSLGMNRQGVSFNWIDDLVIDGLLVGNCGRSCIDIEPFQDAWWARDVIVRNVEMFNPQIGGLAAANWHLIHNLIVDNVTFWSDENAPSLQFMDGGAIRGRFTNIYDKRGSMLIKGKNLYLSNIHSRFIQVSCDYSVLRDLFEDFTNADTSQHQFLQINSGAQYNVIDGVYLKRDGLATPGATQQWNPIGDDSDGTNVVKNIYTGYADQNFTTHFKQHLAQYTPAQSPWFADGLDMYGEDRLNIGQDSVNSTVGPNKGEHSNAPTASASTFDLTFPVIAVKNLNGSVTAFDNDNGDLSGTFDYAVRACSQRGGPGNTGYTETAVAVSGANESAKILISNAASGTEIVRAFCVYRKTNGATYYTHRAILRLYEDSGKSTIWGTGGGRIDTGMNLIDLGSTGIANGTNATAADVAWETGTVTLTGNIYDGAGSATEFEDSNADFLADGVKIGYLITNNDTTEIEVITGVTKTKITHAALSSGNWNAAAGDPTCTITKSWDITADETGWEPDLNYSVFTQPTWGTTVAAEKRHDGILFTWGTNPAAGDLFDYEIRRLNDGS